MLQVQVAADFYSNFIIPLQVRIFLFKNFKQGMIGSDWGKNGQVLSLQATNMKLKGWKQNMLAKKPN